MDVSHAKKIPLAEINIAQSPVALSILVLFFLRKYKERSKGEHNLKAVTYKVMHKERG
jgi:hypothetical protein